jgi:predicted RNA-binding Zn-ribbon protein involved in translation (DUF1610 family)
MSAGASGPEPKIINCPSCGGSITLRALGQSVMSVCPSCGTQIDVSQPEIRLIKVYRLQQQQLHIPLGTRGSLRGQMFEVVGALRRGDQAGHWEEYLLFNPYIGFRWLVYDTGHWSLGQMIKDTAHILGGLGGARYDGHSFRKYHRGEPVITWIVGEFYWRAKVGDQVEATDYIAPPYMLSSEKTPSEMTWTYLQYIEPEEIEAAFHIESPERQWLAANQPNPAATALRAVKPIMLAALAAAVIVQIGTAIHARNATLPVGTYDLGQAQGEGQTYGPFTFERAGSMNEVKATAHLNNSWVELQCSLVNTVTGQSIDFTNSFSYYSGIDSDGGWSEGSWENASLITNVPAGTYKLIVAGGGADQSGLPLKVPVYLSLRHDIVPWRNFWLAVLAILIYPGYLLYRNYANEKERWSEADPV